MVFALKTDMYCWKAGQNLNQWKSLFQKSILYYCCGVHGLQTLSAFSLSILITVYRGCYKYAFCHQHVNPMISTVNICPMV